MFVSAAGASQFGVSWTETLGADPRTEACAVSASERSSVPRHTVFQPLRTDNVARIKKIIVIIIGNLIQAFCLLRVIGTFLS